MLPAPTEAAVLTVSEELRVSPTIVAGRIRYETNDYQHLGSLVGTGQVREQFEEYGKHSG